MHYEKFQDGTVKCIEDEIPFAIPKGWTWTRLPSISQEIFAGGDKPKIFSEVKTNECNIPIFSNGVENEGLYGYTNKPRVTNTSLTISGRGTIGFCCVRNEPFVPIVRLITIVPCCEIDIKYLNIVFKTLVESGVGSSIPQLTVPMVSSKLVPLPPKKEQILIAELYNRMIPYLEYIEYEKKNINQLIDVLKSKILDLAIHGQLVPQDPNHEPASVLLERIRTEKEELIKQGKIKRDKKESIIFRGEDNSYYETVEYNINCIDSEIQFNLPKGWAWERLGNVTSIARGGSPRPIKAFLTNNEDGINWIKIGDTEKDGKYIYSTKEKIKREGISKSRYVKSGDFLLTNSMSFGRPYILKTDGCIHDGWLVIGDIENIFDQDYLYYALSSSFMYKTLAVMAGGSTVDNLNSDLVKSLLFPIPPIKEQVRIAKQIELIFSTINFINKNISV